MTGPAEPAGRPESEPGSNRERQADVHRAQHAQAAEGSTIVQALGDIHLTQQLSDTPPPPEAMRTLVLDVPDFTGRGRELAQLLAGVSGVVAVHAVNGMAGVGKTALIRRAARLLADRFPDGQLFVDLHAHTPGQTPADPAAVLASLLDKTGLDPRHLPADLEDRAARWRDRIAGRKVLLVLDDAVSPAQVRPLLPGPGDCLVLITSRGRLDVEEAEHLALPILPADEAVELFIRVCRRTPVPAEIGAVEEIVRRCGFLPLAIVLLARRLIHRPAWSVAHLADIFTTAADRLAVLRSGDRPGDLAVAAAFEMSYRDLTSARQRLFRLLGLHPGLDFDAHAAAALAGISLAQAHEDLDALYLDHLLIETPASPGRYELHDLLREYARTLAGRHDGEQDRGQALERLLDHYQRTAQTAEHHLANYTRPGAPPAPDAAMTAGPDLPDRAAALGWMRTERANLLACIDHATRNDLYGRVIWLTAAMAAFLHLEGPWAQAAALHQVAIAAAQHEHDSPGEASALRDLGRIREQSGDYAVAIGLLERALTVYREIGDHLGEANVLNELGYLRQQTGDIAATARLLERALTIYREIGDSLGEANVLNELGYLRRQSGDYAAATELLEQALTIYQQLGHRVGEADVLNELGYQRRQSGDHAAATELLEQALAIYQQLGHRVGEANVLNDLGYQRQQSGDYAAATELLEQALTVYQQFDIPVGEANVLNDLGRIHLMTGDHPAATELLERALSLFRQIGGRLGEANVLNDLGRVHLMTGDHPAATELLERALSLFRQIGDPQGEAAALNNMGALVANSAGPQEAVPVFEQALRLTRQISSPLDEAHALEGIARCAVRTGDREAAITRLGEAVAIYRRLGSPEAAAAAAYLATL
ncbi:ATP-binding protein [Streptosporangium carneum]|uniref:ATPase n=1 Tax=Streptosporangium carneum TaxID=47481 RepID=A0A9W6I024_9ACTN|nr:tetratricopeptide repeat protein [Streptosporangium carneum]GLK09217.1 ATPase [Streptosporangium carneum]